jgi:hypothetical protein
LALVQYGAKMEEIIAAIKALVGEDAQVREP